MGVHTQFYGAVFIEQPIARIEIKVQFDGCKAIIKAFLAVVLCYFLELRKQLSCFFEKIELFFCIILR